MNKIDVTIHVFQDNINLSSDIMNKYGKIFSTLKSIKVNNVNGKYSILYKDNVFEKLNQKAFSANLLKVFFNNLTNRNILFTIEYHCDGQFSNLNCIAQVLVFNEIMSKLKTTAYQNNNYVSYVMSDSLRELCQYVCDNFEYDDDDDEEDEDSEEGEEVLSTLQQILGGIENDDDDDEEDDYNKKKHKKSKKHYQTSKVIRTAKNPKKSYNRHGVITVDKKSSIKTDEKIIKSFLKDFIPGDAGWKKDLRQDLLKRWMDSYAITRKKLKEMERKYRRKQEEKYRNRNPEVQTALDFARKMFNQSMDNWNDPRR